MVGDGVWAPASVSEARHARVLDGQEAEAEAGMGFFQRRNRPGWRKEEVNDA